VKPLDNNSTENGSMLLLLLLLLRPLQGWQREHDAAAVKDVATHFGYDCKQMAGEERKFISKWNKQRKRNRSSKKIPSLRRREQLPSSRWCDGGIAPTTHARTLLPKNLRGEDSTTQGNSTHA
jgi:hypothetical protein